MSKTIKGKASNVGFTVKGVARKANGDASNVQFGDILIAKTTDAHMLGGMKRAAGIITETGGFMSHAAVVCRELGKPFVLQATGILNEVVDGDIVSVDPATGEVTIG